MLKTINIWLKNKIYEQTVDHSTVRSVFNYDQRKNTFFINSCAGSITFKPKNLNELTSFRNEWANRFPVDGGDFFKFYVELLRSKYKVSYSANIRTRLRLIKCALRNWF